MRSIYEKKRIIAMKTKSVVSLFILLCITSLVVEACNMPGTGTHPLVPPTALTNSAVTISMDTPHNGAIYTVGSAAPLGARVNAPSRESIRSVTFLANGASVGTGVGGDGYLFNTFSTTWTPQVAGEYYVQGQITLTDGATAISDPVRICVMPLTEAVPADWSGYLGPCEMPTRIPNAASTGDVTMSGVAAPSEVCTTDAAITFIVNVSDPQDQVALVGVMLFRPDTSNDTALRAYLNWTTTRPVNQEEYRATIHLTPDFMEGAADNLQLFWRAYAFGRDGRQIALFRGNEITVRYVCRPRYEILPSATPVQQHLETAPSETPMPQACIWEAAVNVFLRKGPDVGIFDKLDSVVKGKTLPIIGQSQDGQFWAVQVSPKLTGYVTKADAYSLTSGDCSNVPTLKDPEPPEIKIPPTKKPGSNDNSGGSSGTDCSSYTTDSSCNAAPGCSYDYGAKACK
jgi:hypothetical protein